MNQKIIAAIDIGTNSIHMVVVKIEPSLPSFTVIAKEKDTVRLGDRDTATGKLTPEAIKRSLDTLRRCRDLAHSLEAEKIIAVATSGQILNCGYGTGYSVREVLSKIREISGVDFSILETPRRAGDPACVVASGDKIREVIGWEPQHNSLDEIVSSALEWEKKKLKQLNLV